MQESEVQGDRDRDGGAGVGGGQGRLGPEALAGSYGNRDPWREGIGGAGEAGTGSRPGWWEGEGPIRGECGVGVGRKETLPT